MKLLTSQLKITAPLNNYSLEPIGHGKLKNLSWLHIKSKLFIASWGPKKDVRKEAKKIEWGKLEKKARSLLSIIHQRLGCCIFAGRGVVDIPRTAGPIDQKKISQQPSCWGITAERSSATVGQRKSENLCSSFQSLAYRNSSLLHVFLLIFSVYVAFMWNFIYSHTGDYHVHAGTSRSYLYFKLKYSYPLDIASNWLCLKLNTFLSFNIHLLPQYKRANPPLTF